MKQDTQLEAVAPGYQLLLPAKIKSGKMMVIAYDDSKLKHKRELHKHLPEDIPERICCGVFTIKGKDQMETQPFIAISLHGPHKINEADQLQYFERFRAFVDQVIGLGLHVIIGGDFNASVCWWHEVYQYSYMHYKPTLRRMNVIDFITMKGPADTPYSVTDVEAMLASNEFDHDPIHAKLKYEGPVYVAEEGPNDEEVEEVISGLKELSAS